MPPEEFEIELAFLIREEYRATVIASLSYMVRATGNYDTGKR